MLSVENLEFSYKTKKVLQDISFEAEGNSVVSLLGPNGVGKTTLLKCICNIHRPQKGVVSVNGTDVLKLSRRELARHVGYVPQKSPAVRATVFDSVLIGRRPYIEWNATQDDISKTWAAIRALGLEELSLRYLDELSGGEFQKVQVARAIVQEPDVLIMDEPTSNLDIANQHMTMHMVIDAVRSKGVCTLMTMHDINLAVHYSDRLLFMKDGRIAAYGGTEIITEELVKEVYGIDVDVIDHRGAPFIIPLSRGPLPMVRHDHKHDHPHDVRDHLHDVYGSQNGKHEH